MATFDYFVGPVKCAACGHVCDDKSSNMQTKLQVRPTLAELTIGEDLDVDWSHVGSAGYFEVSAPVNADTVSILETWECPNCDKPFNWAKVEIVDGKIESIHEIELSTENLQKANYISVECRYLLDTPTAPESTIDALVAQLHAS